MVAGSYPLLPDLSPAEAPRRGLASPNWRRIGASSNPAWQRWIGGDRDPEAFSRARRVNKVLGGMVGGIELR